MDPATIQEKVKGLYPLLTSRQEFGLILWLVYDFGEREGKENVDNIIDLCFITMENVENYQNL